MKIRRVRLDDIEAQMLTGIIVSNDYLRRVRTKLKGEHLVTAYGGVLLKW